MCFSAQASFAVATILVGVSFITLRMSKNRAQVILGLTPLFFALQQALEGIVWITLNHQDATSSLHKLGLYGFLFFATIFWPLWIPNMLYLIEKNHQRKVMLAGTTFFGLIFSGVAALELIMQGAHVAIVQHNLAYTIPLPTFIPLPYATLAQIAVVLYCLAAVLPLLITSVRLLWVLGLLIIAGLAIAYAGYAHAFGSVWCLTAAITSSLILGSVWLENRR